MDADLHKSFRAIMAATSVATYVGILLLVTYLVSDVKLKYSNFSELFCGGMAWTWLAIILAIILPMFAIRIARWATDKNPTKEKLLPWLYAHGVVAISCLFCLIAATGGLTGSPFTVYLPLYLAVVAIVTEDEKQIKMFLALVVIVGAIPNLVEV